MLCFFLIMYFTSCSDNQQKLLPASSGNINNISVVTSDELWDGAVGDIIRENFGRPIVWPAQIDVAAKSLFCSDRIYGLPLSVVEDNIPEPTAVTPSSKFISAAVEVIAVPPMYRLDDI